MALILRIDVDKPYGNSSLFKRIISKFSEDVLILRCHGMGYLSHLKKLILFCNEQKIQGYFFHRICTAPTAEIIELYKSGGHIAGLHAENTRSYETFSAELNSLSKLTGQRTESFTKHGSGDLKLGKYHYAPYEPEKYSEWAKTSGCRFHFGNLAIDKAENLTCKNDFYPYMFWIDKEYRYSGLDKIEDVTELAKTKDVPVLIHPCEFITSQTARNDFEKLVELAKQKSIRWILPF